MKNVCNTKYKTEIQEDVPFKEFLALCSARKKNTYIYIYIYIWVELKLNIWKIYIIEKSHIYMKRVTFQKELSMLIGGGEFLFKTRRQQVKANQLPDSYHLSAASIPAGTVRLYLGGQWGSVRRRRWACGWRGAELAWNQACWLQRPSLITTLIFPLWRLSLLIS